MSENVHIQDKLADIQRKMNVPKSQYNKFGNYNYRNAEDILSEFKKYSSEYGLCLTINDEVLEIGGRIYVRATATLKSGAESISISGYAREAEKQKGMDEAQITGAASSYARKYALNGIFLLDDVKDPDTNEFADQQGRKNGDGQKNTSGNTKINQSHINSLRSMFQNKGIDESKVLIAYKIEKIEELTISQYKGIFNNQKEMKERYGV